MSKPNLSNPLPMTDAEILASFNNAIVPSRQCKILAELNATSVDRIKEIFLRMGVDGRRLPRKKPKESFKLTEKTADPPEEAASEAAEAPPCRGLFGGAHRARDQKKRTLRECYFLRRRYGNAVGKRRRNTPFGDKGTRKPSSSLSRRLRGHRETSRGRQAFSEGS